jgi:Ca2+-binding RTX toxin-like protein
MRPPFEIRKLARLLCVTGVGVLAYSGIALAEASHEGWPPIGHHEGHPNNESGTMRGLDGVHNMLLGGDGNDTIWAGNEGDVIWGDSHPEGNPGTQRDFLHGGPGEDWLYASHGYNVIWTGAGNDHVALVYGYGTVYCNGPGLKTLVMRYLPQNRHYNLVGCDHTAIVRYRA